MRGIAIIAGAVCLAGCSVSVIRDGSNAGASPIVSRFDPAEVAWARKPGTATVIGSGLLRTKGGDIKTCAGEPVSLVPASRYASERMMHYYGNTEAGFFKGSAGTIGSDDPGYVASEIQTVCDAQGAFSFDHLAAGTYYAETLITWRVPFARYSSTLEGGLVFRRITIGDGETRKVVLTG